MKKYERIIKNLVEMDNESFKVYELKLTKTPGSDEWKELEAKEEEYDELIMQEFVSFSKCIEWYARRAKTSDDLELVEELRGTYKELYDHLVCDLSDEEINEMATVAAKEILGDIMEGNIPTEEVEEVRTKKVVEAKRNELIRQSDAIMKEHDAIDGNASLEDLNRKTLLLNQMLRLEQEILRLGIEYAAAAVGSEESDNDEPEAIEDVTQERPSQSLNTLRIDGYAVTVEGTWYEVSDGESVVAYGNCDAGTSPRKVYEVLKRNKELP